MKKVLSAVYEKNFHSILDPKGDFNPMSIFTHLSRIVTSNIDQNFKYSKCKISTADKILEPLISFNKLRIRLIINAEKKLKNFLLNQPTRFVAHYPPIMMSGFKNIILASVGNKEIYNIQD